MRKSKSAIALLITVMFVIVISVAIGVGLKQINSATQELKTEKFMYQSTLLIEDVLKILGKNKELKAIVDQKSVEGMFLFLSQAKFIPFESSGLSILLSIESARSKYNLRNLDVYSVSALKYYVENNRVDTQYVEMLLDAKSGIKVDNSYNSNIFDENPYLFRDYVASAKHLRQINDAYAREYNDNSLTNIKFENLLYYTKESNTSIDLNYAKPEVWEMMLGVTKERAKGLYSAAGSYRKLNDLNLGDDEKFKLSKFKTSFFQPYILVSIEIMQGDSESKIIFEYDIKNKKGLNFVYEI